MSAASSSDTRVAALVHTHGTRVVRLGHLLAVPSPQLAAADALAAAVLLRSGRDDAHAELMAAASVVGARGRPPVHDAARLQGWLDRAELAADPVDLTALHAATVQRMAVQQAHRATYRRRAAAATVAVAAVGATAVVLDGADRQAPDPAPALVTGSIEGYPADPVERRRAEVVWPLTGRRGLETGVALSSVRGNHPARRA